MNHDVYICYDEKDKDLNDALFRIFNDNNIKVWTKSKNMASTDSVDKITNAIDAAECFILILSKNSKDTNYIITETDIAFSKNVPIIVVDIEETKIIRNLEFIIETQTVIPTFPNTKKQLEKIVRETSTVIDKPVKKVKLNSQSVKVFEKINPKRKENNIKKYIKIAIPIAIVLILIYLFVLMPTGQKTTEDGLFTMDITNVEVNGNNYAIKGESYNLPANCNEYIMNIKFLDKNENLIYEVNSTADEFKFGTLWQGDLPSDNITHINFKLIDLNNNVLSKENYALD